MIVVSEFFIACVVIRDPAPECRIFPNTYFNRMDNRFEIPITYHSEDYNFTAELIAYAFSYKIAVNIFGEIIFFEPDEEGHFRAVVGYEQVQQTRIIDKTLLEAIAEKLVLLLRD